MRDTVRKTHGIFGGSSLAVRYVALTIRNKTGKTRKRRARASRRPRSSRRRTRGPASPPATQSRALLPRDYAKTLGEIKKRIRSERLRVVMAANAAMVLLYWDVGRMILHRQAAAGWGAMVIDRLSADLRATYPDMKGLSPRNLKYMRAFAAAWPQKAIVQEVLAQLPWYHHIALMEKCRTPDERLWYVRRSVEQGWSHNTLSLQIESRAHKRHGKALTNFKATLPSPDSDVAAEVFKDPYLLDFLGTADLRREREIEQALMDHIQRFLLELGDGFALVGRQVPLAVAGRDYCIDLLFYHLKLRCYVVIELKVGAFDPAFTGQINFYLSVVDDLLRHPDDKPTIGLLLCRSSDRIVVEYALRGLKKPIGVAAWETKIAEALPKHLRGSLPTVEELEAELTRDDHVPPRTPPNTPAVRSRSRRAARIAR
jgi:predicted nuclease of restriction endonuclease-like (RecB) superfamily